MIAYPDVPGWQRLLTTRRWVHGHIGCVWAVLACLLPGAVQAQSFDCGKAQDALDRAICASPRLRQLDTELAAAYAAALKRDAGQGGALRETQRSWVTSRAACVSNAAASATVPAHTERCLTAAYTNRIAVLAATAVPVVAPPRPAGAGLPQSVAAAVPAPVAAGPATLTAAQGREPAAFAAPHLATGLPALPAGAATLERDHFPTAGETDVLLHVTSPGRFAIRAQSSTGAALQLVDMLTGPGDRQGWPGKQDGRIDALLDTGTYKVRSFGDPAAIGDTVLSVSAFTEAGPAQLAPGYQPVATTLDDLQLRSFWLVVGDAAATSRIEAAGRSLAALKLWRDGRDLVDLTEMTSVTASTPVHPLTDIVVSGHVSPGTYLVTAYGGPPLPWADGASDEPLYLRTGRSTDLLAGGASGRVGVFGTEAFDTPPDAASVLLILPQPAEAHLTATAPGVDAASVDLAKTDRSRTALLALPGKPAQQRPVELQAASGQAFVLRPAAMSGDHPGRPGQYWFGAAELANGGDEAPAAAILTRTRIGTKGSDATLEVLASPGVPSVGPDKAWRSRFNLRGDSDLLFQVTGVVTVAVHSDGPPVTARITTLEGAVLNAMGNGRAATSWALSPGFYTLALTVKPEAIGILDLTLGPPGLIPPAPEPPGPEAPVLPLGEQSVDAQSHFGLLVNHVPDGDSALLSRPVPLELADGPLVETLSAGEALSIAVRARTAGTLVTRDIADGAVLDSRQLVAGASTTVTVPAADHPRSLAVALLPVASSTSPRPAPAPNLASLRDGQPAFLDLARGKQASFALTVGQGGLYRVESTGRLKTAGQIGTSFIPVLGEASANGVGQNMLLQRYLRAGRYRLQVTAQDSAGRLGVNATPTRLADGAELAPGGSTRATVTPDRGVAFPIRIAVAGRYHLDLLGDGRTFSARLEDPDGWPLRAAGDLSSIDQDLAAGQYRLIVQPPSVQARVIARLQRIAPPMALSGHGPHPLPFDLAQSLEWREPPGRDDPRTPDTWTFALSGPASVTLSLDGNGMAASLQAETAAPDAPPLGRLLAGTPLTIDLAAGHYRVAATSLGRNDRLAYTISLHSKELQPDAPRNVTLPATLPFAVAEPRVVSLTSFGGVPLRAELRDSAGHLLAQSAGRTDDWNIAVSRFVPAGSFTLTLATLAPPVGEASPDSSDDSSDNSQDSQSTPAGDTGDNSMANDSSDQSSDQSAGANADQDQQNSDQNSSNKPPASTEVALRLPPNRSDVVLASDGSSGGSIVLTAGGVQHVTLPAAPMGALQVVAAQAPVELILALEQRAADGSWHTLGQSQGLTPVLGVPVGDASAARRIAIWTPDGGTVPVQVAARAVTGTPAPIGPATLSPVALGGITQRWNAALVADPGALMLSLVQQANGLLVASSPDQPAVPPAGGTIVAQSDAIWLLSPDAATPRLAVIGTGLGDGLSVSVPAAGRATLPLTAPAGSALCAYVAESGLGQPGLQAGHGMGTTAGSAFALCGARTVSAWNAGDDTALRLKLRRLELASQPAVSVDQNYAGSLPPRAALNLHLPTGMKRLDISLATGEAVVAGWQGAGALTAWTGETPLSRSLTGDWTDVLMVNTKDEPQPAAMSVTAVAQPLSLVSGGMFRRFYGARGSFVLPLTAKAGQRLMVAGAAHAVVQQPDGKLRQGRAVPLDGPASAVVSHGTGPLALWIEGPDVSPWPNTAPRDVALPQRLALDNEAMTLRLSLGAPVLLRMASTAPLILAVGREAPALFGNGVALERYLPAGTTTLRLLSPQDGPLTGTLELSGNPVTQVAEGLGAPVVIPPGGAAVFGFTVTATGPVGLGVRAVPDRVAVRLLNEHGETLQSGVSMLRRLVPGHYLLEATVPPDAPTTLARPAVLGTVPHPNPPPADVVRGLMIAAGFTPPDSAR